MVRCPAQGQALFVPAGVRDLTYWRITPPRTTIIPTHFRYTIPLGVFDA